MSVGGGVGGVHGGLAGWRGWGGGGVACAQATGALSSAVQSAESCEKPSKRKPCSPTDPRSLWHQAPARPRGRREKRQALLVPAGSAEQSRGSRSAAGSAFSTVVASQGSGSPELRGEAGRVGGGGLELSGKQEAGEAAR